MGPATWDSRQSDNRPHSGNGLRSRNCQLNILLKYSTIKYSLIKIGELDYTSITVDEGDNMTTREHMANLAQRYADALVAYHMDKNADNFEIVCDLQNMLNMVCEELAQEETV